MTEGFKPFYVDVSEVAARLWGMNFQTSIEVGRYLVIAVSCTSNSVMPSAPIIRFVAVSEKTKAIVTLPEGGKFAGFRGECMMCDHRKVDESF